MRRRCRAREAAPFRRRSTTARITSCSSPFRLTTLGHSRQSGARNSRASRSPALAPSSGVQPAASSNSAVATFTSNSAAETIAFARAWAQALVPNDVVALVGDLGAGKTHFVKGLLQGLESAEEATSPTFTLVHEYRGGRLPLFHFDFYRLNQLSEIAEIGFDDYLEENGIAVVEW